MPKYKIKGYERLKQGHAYQKAMLNLISGKEVNTTSQKKKRMPSKPIIKESDLQSDIKKDLKMMEFFRSIAWWDRYNSGRIRNGLYWITLCREGTADLAIWLNNGKVIFIETKGKGGHTDKQIIFMDTMQKAGHKYFLVKTLEEWEKIKSDICNDIIS